VQQSYLDRVTNKIRGTLRELTAAQVVDNDGIKLIVDRDVLDDPALIRAVLFNQHERTEAELVKYALRPDDRVLELGSGLGFITMICARICGAPNVVTVEGNPTMYELLKRNLALNGHVVDARRAVVSLEGGPVTFQIALSKVSSSLYTRDNATGRSVHSVSFRELLAEVRPTMIVMDIEGSEVDLLGTLELPGVRAIGVETHPQIVGTAAIARMQKRLDQIGFRIDPRFPAESSRHLYIRS
jgi:FkbM family methyltransferase